MNGLNWYWIGLQVIVPMIVAMLVAWPFWLRKQPIFGNLAGTVVLFASAFALIMREHTEIDFAVRRCLDQGFTCFPEPSAFTRFATYAFVALIQVIALFSVSLSVEAQLRRRGYDPQWR
jgi:hypothetical protein